MKIICAWCGKFLGGDPNSSEVSHGICAECKAEQERELEQLRKALGKSK